MSETRASALKIAIDARMYQESGIGRYIRNLIKELDGENEYLILLRKKDFDTITFKKNFKKVLADFSWYGIKEQIKLPSLLNSLNVDLVHFPHFNVPFFYNGKFVVTIHDLIHQHFQMRRVTLHDPITYKIKQLGYKAIFRNAIKKSGKILVPSNYVKDLLVQEWGVVNEKIVVTPEAVDEKIISLIENLKQHTSPLEIKTKNILEKFDIRYPYIFYVGNAHPHKNIEGLIKTFIILRKKYQDLTLVLSGSDHYFWQRIKQSLVASPLKKDIIFTGAVSDEELVVLYRNARCFLMPSFEEGFGIPLLEAMSCECPVVSSNAGSLKEVGGDAALYFDPGDKGDMIDKINQVLSSEEKRLELIEKGKKRVKLFNWKTLAKETLEVYQQCT